MLTADQIEALGNRAQQLLSPVQDYLIREIASRIKEAGSMTATAQYQVWRLQNLGVSQRQLKKELRRLMKISHRDLRKLLMDAGEDGYTYDISHLPQVQAIPFAESKVVQDIVSAAVELAQDDLTNITQSLGFCLDGEGKVCLPLSEAYERACDTAFMRVSTGAADMQTAVREATRGLARKGIQYIDYETGIHTSIEAATRRSIMGGMGLMQEKISQHTHDAMGANGWEISAHACSAPDHEPIQGKQYTDAEYQALNNSLRRRIGTLNCGHAAHPIIIGVSRPQYTEEELRSFRQDNEVGVEIEEEHLTMYEATQRQRALERAMRVQKKRIIVAEATGDPHLSQLQSRMQVLSQEYSRFSDQAGLRTQVERTYVAGTGRRLSNHLIERGSGPITQITDEAIEKVPEIEIPGATDNENQELQKWHKKLLRLSRDKNNNNETAIVLSSDFQRHQVVFGNEKNVEFHPAPFGSGKYLIHNHPRNHSFSAPDVTTFIGDETISTMTAVKNNGHVESLTKLKNYDTVQVVREYYRALKKDNPQTDAQFDKFIAKFLNKMNSKEVILWQKK